MKRKIYIIVAFILFSVSSLQAQTTEGTEFWLTFGANGAGDGALPNLVDLQIRIVAKDHQTNGTIFFTNLNTYVDFEIGAKQVYTYILSEIEKAAVYNSPIGNNYSVITHYSAHITTTMPVTVYALNQGLSSTDATNVLPVTALGTKYYQISYTSPLSRADAYAVIATENNTQVYQDNIPVATLNRGDVYYKGRFYDMTGACISSDKPIAHFALAGTFAIFGSADNLFQQMAPMHVWGKNFFAPVSHPVRDVVRIVVSQDNTNIWQEGGTIRAVSGAQTTLENLQPGQFVELEVPIGSNGCYIKANKPVGVLTFYGGGGLCPGGNCGDSSPAWLPPIEQSVATALIAPFIPSGNTNIHSHYAVVVTPTATRDNTKVSIGGASPTDLTGGSWIENDTAKMSFYKMPLTNATAAYYFTNPTGFLIFCYGYGNGESYYYLAYSAMRDLDASFYANDIHFQDLKDATFCANEVVNFRAEIENMGVEIDSIKWYINGFEETTTQNLLEWNKTFLPGNYEIKMWVRFENDSIISKADTLRVKSCEVNAAFYANNVHYENLQDTVFCAKDVYFRAEIEGQYEELKWFIDNVEEVSAQNQEEWSKQFTTGEYAIKMQVRYARDLLAP